MEGEVGEVGVIVSIIHTCGWRGPCEQQEVWAGGWGGVGLVTTVAATWRFSERSLSWEGSRCGAL